ncbi:STAS domain-containing protein [Cytobacillus oceanisediminis]|uniref:STAS domain-containing protein n=1 Tax=Niallia alba TaxID=2729105 RepID=A0A7Y0K690_9BACI|nr:MULTISPECIES: SulP family inorganic anion transporter [Bacillaceae]MBQ6447678.1 STAS domain-containing protein [Bacillus sp. (in: firmicutes)]MBZ9536495.1 STAS domain-containing protein [Cytobacillus oceanisediminis]NMO76555.1 STAS domain-containing protein [Niallia alba]
MKWKLIDNRFTHYSFASFRKDITSGIIVGIIAIPLGMAFAIASGVKPEFGIYTTIIAGIIISLLGGSKFQIGGPTGAFIPIVLGIVLGYGFENLLIAGFLAGVILILFGLFKLGSLIKYIPRSVTIGFTSGIAVIIFTGQIPNFLGLRNIEKHEAFLANMREIIQHFDTVSLYSIFTAVICLVIILLSPKWFPKLPGPLMGLIISTIIATFFYPSEIATIDSMYGGIPNKLPSFHLPPITWDRITLLIQPAFVIAILGAIESLLSAVVADGMTNSKHNSNKELIGQGIANMIAPLFGGIPATGAIARTATNIKSGAVSPLSGIIHGIVVLVVLMVLAPFAGKIPLASMAPLLMVVAWNMSEQKSFRTILKTKTGDSLVLSVTFLLTVFFDLTTAVEIGLFLAIIIFTKRMSDIMKTSQVLPSNLNKLEKLDQKLSHGCPQISIFDVEGPLFFGAAQAFEQTLLRSIHRQPEILILRMGKVPFMDLTGEAYFANIVESFSKHGKVLICGINPQPEGILRKTGLFEKIGPNHFFIHTGEAIDYSLLLVNKHQCQGCKYFAFQECETLANQQDQRVNESASIAIK